ncbi:GNAT family N-acetyltransferase [Tamlana sp. 2_MG-2023]|uniref:GNAT family N-acetyltransferase n=1 Tax=unclassified Tamlana TaxID=2614803 RepID=UPI0026E3671C|nr:MULTISPECIES: GNAT family N-acetyltransferase [unclassified Tamlana]MDO6759688.1 GNAT family N-acetyltransferase [Tamlana sp. 2_MG-2023]MDO6791311.1 GNAT family N-acetyltransferase [Tamlana sp. 1_MG-2023]
MLKYIIKTFEDLTTTELYKLLQLRSEVFVVEQDCVYQDIDGKDDKALHVLGYKGKKLVAYTRVFEPGLYFESASIGRVLVAKSQRNHQYGYELMEMSIEVIRMHFRETKIKISAQYHLKQFYNNLGFKEVGDTYLEDDIPHIGMYRV